MTLISIKLVKETYCWHLKKNSGIVLGIFKSEKGVYDLLISCSAVSRSKQRFFRSIFIVRSYTTLASIITKNLTISGRQVIWSNKVH